MIGGTVLGAMIGGELGARMDRRDEQQTVQAFESGQPTTWTNPDTGYRYEVQPQPEYQADVGTCRDYTMNAVIEGRTEVVTGTACRQPDGTWEIIG
jgi:surface antigen